MLFLLLISASYQQHVREIYIGNDMKFAHYTTWQTHFNVSVVCPDKIKTWENGRLAIIEETYLTINNFNRTSLIVAMEEDQDIYIRTCKYSHDSVNWIPFNIDIETQKKLQNYWYSGSYIQRKAASLLGFIIKNTNKLKLSAEDKTDPDAIHFALRHSVDIKFNANESIAFVSRNNSCLEVIEMSESKELGAKSVFSFFIKTLSALWSWITWIFRKIGHTIMNHLKNIARSWHWPQIGNIRKILWHHLLQIQSYTKEEVRKHVGTMDINKLFITENEAPPEELQNLNEWELDPPKQKPLEDGDVLFDLLLNSTSNKTVPHISNFASNFNFEPAVEILESMTSIFNVTNTTDVYYSALTSFKSSLSSFSFKNIIGALWRFLKTAWQLLSSAIVLVGTFITKLLSTFIPLFMTMHNVMINIPLWIPFLSSYLCNKLNATQITLLDFFFIPMSHKIYKQLHDKNIAISNEEVIQITGTNLPHSNTLPHELIMKWHYIVSFGVWYLHLFQVPFIGLEMLPVLGNLNPLWNIAPYAAILFTFPYDLTTNSLENIQLFILSMFPVCVNLIPADAIPFAPLIVDILTTTIFGVPHFINTMRLLQWRTTKNLPMSYKDKKWSLWKHNSLEVLMSLPLLTDIMTDPMVLGWFAIPFQVPVFGLQLIQANMGIGMVAKSIEWNATYMPLYKQIPSE